MSDVQLDLPLPVTASALPKCDEDRIEWIRLVRSRRVGISTFLRLLRQHGSVSAALDALPGVARAAGETGYHPMSRSEAEAEFAAGSALGARLLCLGEQGYPARLKEIADPPPILWCLGGLPSLSAHCVGIVGARVASAPATGFAEIIARELGEAGLTVVSGLARGIDAAAHRGSVGTGTAAVLAGGVDHVYPKENARLYGEIRERGLLFSERPPGFEAKARHFPIRNRLISGMSDGLVIVEAAEKSGSLIAARAGLEQGREVMAAPGLPLDPRSAGNNGLIRDGATLIRSAADVLEQLAFLSNARPSRALRPEGKAKGREHPESAAPVKEISGDAQERVLQFLSRGPSQEDNVIRMTGLSAASIGALVTELELDGRVERRADGTIARCA